MPDDDTCPECGARYSGPETTCRARFDALLALDHSRHEPWGSRHGLAFAVYSLQHPASARRETLVLSWLILNRVYRFGDDPLRLATALRRHPDPTPAEFGVAPFPGGLGNPSFAVTIADLGDFGADRYPADLDRWCQATLDAFGRES